MTFDQAQILTASAPFKLSNVSFFISEDRNRLKGRSEGSKVLKQILTHKINRVGKKRFPEFLQAVAKALMVASRSDSELL